MTRRDYELIARVLARARGPGGLYSEDVDTLARDMADALASTNPRFDRERFLAACRDPHG